MKYRIRVNGNGKYRVQRRFGLFWYDWRDAGTYDRAGWCDGGYTGSTYEDSEQAVSGLLRAQGQDQQIANEGRWTTVVEEGK